MLRWPSRATPRCFPRTYSFLSSIIPYTNAEWEKLSIFLDLLIPKLPAPKEEDLAKGILEAIDMDSYRVEKKAVMKIDPRPSTWQGHAAPVKGRHAGLQTVRRERVVPTIRGRHGLCAYQPMRHGVSTARLMKPPHATLCRGDIGAAGHSVAWSTGEAPGRYSWQTAALPRR
jgi:hypothetical protein